MDGYIQSRNISSHTYDEETTESLFIVIINDHYPLFTTLKVEIATLVLWQIMLIYYLD